jgi:anti-sigma B factor antagonist
MLPLRGDMETNRPVLVKRMPERLKNREVREFVREIDSILNTDRPQVVFDCSQVQEIDAAGVEFLLHCLGTVMRRDGDLKLASVPPRMAVILEMTRTDRLFEIYDSSSDAVLSFSRFVPSAMRNVITTPAWPALEEETVSRDSAA